MENESSSTSAPAVLSQDASTPQGSSRDDDGDATTMWEDESPSDSGGGGGARTLTATTLTAMTTSASASSSDVLGDTTTSNGSEGSGYGSDSSPDTRNGGDLTDSSGTTSGFGVRKKCGEGGDDGDSDDSVDDATTTASDDIMEKIYFLREKQHILERAGNVLNRRPETSYAAAMASELCRGLTTESSSSSSGSSDDDGNKKAKRSNNSSNIWSEARRVLSVINKKGTGGRDDSFSTRTPPPPVPAKVYRKRCAPNPMNPLINTGIVHMIRSRQYESTSDDSQSDSDAGSVGAMLGLPRAGSNQWLTKALLWSSSSPTNPARPTTANQGSWSLTTDPLTHSFGLVPPPTVSLEDAVDLQDVINVSDEARVVTQSSPPFCVVHVNRAFLEMADLPGHETLVGRPVETIFRLADFVDPNSLSAKPNFDGHQGPAGEGHGRTGPFDSRYMVGTVHVGRNGGNSLCRLRVLPVVDRSRRRRLGKGTSGPSFPCVSHILIQVEAGSDQEPPSSSVPAPAEVTDAAAANGSPPAPLCHPSSCLHGGPVAGSSGVIG